METDFEAMARARYSARVAHLDGHHCPAWEGLPLMMREHLIALEHNNLESPDEDTNVSDRA